MKLSGPSWPTGSSSPPTRGTHSCTRTSYGVKVLGHTEHILGIAIAYLPSGSIFVSQRAYLEATLTKFGKNKCCPLWTPMEPGRPSTGQVYRARRGDQRKGNAEPEIMPSHHHPRPPPSSPPPPHHIGLRKSLCLVDILESGWNERGSESNTLTSSGTLFVAPRVPRMDGCLERPARVSSAGGAGLRVRLC